MSKPHRPIMRFELMANATIFTARCYTERGYDTVCRLSVCLPIWSLTLVPMESAYATSY